jgi:hypothetical protein
MPVIIGLVDEYLGFLAGNQFVSVEVMPQPIHYGLGQFADVFYVCPGGIVFEHGDDFIIGLSGVVHGQATDDTGIENQLGMGDGPFTEHTDVQWIMVAFFGIWHQ